MHPAASFKQDSGAISLVSYPNCSRALSPEYLLIEQGFYVRIKLAFYRVWVQHNRFLANRPLRTHAHLPCIWVRDADLATWVAASHLMVVNLSKCFLSIQKIQLAVTNLRPLQLWHDIWSSIKNEFWLSHKSVRVQVSKSWALRADVRFLLVYNDRRPCEIYGVVKEFFP